MLDLDNIDTTDCGILVADRLNIIGCPNCEAANFFLLDKTGGPFALVSIEPDDLPHMIGKLQEIHTQLLAGRKAKLS